MKTSCLSWYACPRGAAVYLYLTPDLVNTKPLKDWSCPNFEKCKDCTYVKIPRDRRKKKTCDFEYAFTDYHIDYMISGNMVRTLLRGCSEEAREIIMDMIKDFTKEAYWLDWLQEDRSKFEKKEVTE